MIGLIARLDRLKPSLAIGLVSTFVPGTSSGSGKPNPACVTTYTWSLMARDVSKLPSNCDFSSIFTDFGSDTLNTVTLTLGPENVGIEPDDALANRNFQDLSLDITVSRLPWR
ncbi:hypothetical protein MiSe_90740 [Microseira wollei NIES-4236]|uniref:Uncharacterized protein n=1 Tax=Microseira wollei NIES-4236 TaxID=2530354 RepID=A0AAV3XR62_9CYAN|nr:hypothetical protein MiSe_90740 [Microseira wollei NIES-4236]